MADETRKETDEELMERFVLCEKINEYVKNTANQFQTALKNMNPSIRTKNQVDTKTSQGNEMSYFDYMGYHLDS